MRPTPTLYDQIGHGYAEFRRPDPRLMQEISLALGDARSVINVGAGTGSYEPDDGPVFAIEPSALMIAQRPSSSGPAVVGRAEGLPLRDRSCDGAMSVMSIQHWADVETGLNELVRVSTGAVVIVTMDMEVLRNHWMVTDYADGILETHAGGFPSIEELTAIVPSAQVVTWEVPRDCTDMFMAALWGRPELYLRPDIRAATSVWHQLPAKAVDAAMNQLYKDLAGGCWDERYGSLRTAESLDVGVRIVRGRVPARGRRSSG